MKTTPRLFSTGTRPCCEAEDRLVVLGEINSEEGRDFEAVNAWGRLNEYVSLLKRFRRSWTVMAIMATIVSREFAELVETVAIDPEIL